MSTYNNGLPENGSRVMRHVSLSERACTIHLLFFLPMSVLFRSFLLLLLPRPRGIAGSVHYRVRVVVVPSLTPPPVDADGKRDTAATDRMDWTDGRTDADGEALKVQAETDGRTTMAGERRGGASRRRGRKERNLLFVAEEARKDGAQKEGGEGGTAVRNKESNVVSGGGGRLQIDIRKLCTRARGCCCKRVFGMGRAALAVISVRRNAI